MKYYKPIGLLACVLLVISCFLPWAYYPDLHKSFSGFFSENDIYGKPGKVFVFFAAVSSLLILTNKIWAKRTLIFLAAFNIGYLIRTYVLFTSCYRGFCPTTQYGMYLLIFSCILLVVVTLFPRIKLKEEIAETFEKPNA